MNRFLIILSIFLFSSATTLSAQAGCSVDIDDLTIVAQVLDDKSSLKLELGKRVGSNLSSLLSQYNTLDVLLGDYHSGYMENIVILQAACQTGTFNLYKPYMCPDINFSKVNLAIELYFTAKAIVSSSSHSGSIATKTELIKLLETESLRTSLSTSIQSLGSACGGFVNPDPEEDPEEEIPGVCTADPYDPVSNFLWKPHSEGGGGAYARKLVVLMNPAGSIRVNGESLVDYGASNGRCTTARSVKTGAQHGKNVVLVYRTYRETQFLVIPDGSNRYDCAGKSYSDCGLKAYTPEYVSKIQKKIRKLAKKRKKANSKKKKRKIGSKIKVFKKLKKAAKLEGII